jgi:NAD(P)-dependent dehydrogenase (short-subunit alcohol dehydrogenase family)
LQLDLADMKQVKSFAKEALDKVGSDKIDYLLLNAGITNAVEEKNRFGSKWAEQYIVNHLCPSSHILSSLLALKSQSRVVG